MNPILASALLSMVRRAVRTLLVIAVVLGSASAIAQPQGRPYRIAVLNNAWVSGNPPVLGLRAGIKAQGLEDGRDVSFDVRSSGGSEKTAAALAAALARENPDVIVAVGESETKAAKAAAPNIPLVFIQVADPVAVGLVASVGRPGGNVTGVANLFAELVPKRLELAKELVPNLRRVLVVYDAQDTASAAGARKAQETAPRLKLNLIVREVRTQEEAVRELKTASARDVLLAPAAMNLSIVELMLNLNLYGVAPAIFASAFWVQAGGAASYGADYYAEGVQAAQLVAKILRGARPADLPVEGVNKLELALNRKTLQAFGVTIPPVLAVRVDRIFEGIGE
jgi:putative tryptophan/tyrosine transport system substrate-binding protein